MLLVAAMVGHGLGYFPTCALIIIFFWCGNGASLVCPIEV